MFPKSSPRRSPETPGVAKTPAEHLVSVQKSIQEGGKWISMGFPWDFYGKWYDVYLALSLQGNGSYDACCIEA